MMLIPLVLWLWTLQEFSFGRFVALGWLVFQALAWLVAELDAVALVRVAEVIGRVAIVLAVGLAPSGLATQDETGEAGVSENKAEELTSVTLGQAMARRLRSL
jgi:hypothetical protein